MTVQKFRSKPKVIEAMQYKAGLMGWYDVYDFVGKALFPYMVDPSSNTIHIETLEGRMACQDGDWIIKGIKGEFYPCKPDIFAASYELLPEAPISSEGKPRE